MVTVTRTTFDEGSPRKDEIIWYDEEADWRVVVADQGITHPNRFNIILSTRLYESKYEAGRILGNERVHSEEALGYDSALARAAELIEEASELVTEYKE